MFPHRCYTESSATCGETRESVLSIASERGSAAESGEELSELETHEGEENGDDRCGAFLRTEFRRWVDGLTTSLAGR